MCVLLEVLAKPVSQQEDLDDDGHYQREPLSKRNVDAPPAPAYI
jgi:hypothetical protein